MQSMKQNLGQLQSGARDYPVQKAILHTHGAAMLNCQFENPQSVSIRFRDESCRGVIASAIALLWIQIARVLAGIVADMLQLRGQQHKLIRIDQASCPIVCSGVAPVSTSRC